MRKPAKKNKDIFEVVAAGLLGVAAGAAAIFFSKKENRDAAVRTTKKVVDLGKKDLAKAKKVVLKTKKKLVRK